MSAAVVTGHSPSEVYGDEIVLLTRQEAAQRMTVTTRTIDRWVASGELPAFRVGGVVRIVDADLAVFIGRHRTTDTSVPIEAESPLATGSRTKTFAGTGGGRDEP